MRPLVIFIFGGSFMMRLSRCRMRLMRLTRRDILGRIVVDLDIPLIFTFIGGIFLISRVVDVVLVHIFVVKRLL